VTGRQEETVRRSFDCRRQVHSGSGGTVGGRALNLGPIILAAGFADISSSPASYILAPFKFLTANVGATTNTFLYTNLFLEKMVHSNIEQIYLHIKEHRDSIA